MQQDAQLHSRSKTKKENAARVAFVQPLKNDFPPSTSPSVSGGRRTSVIVSREVLAQSQRRAQVTRNARRCPLQNTVRDNSRALAAVATGRSPTTVRGGGPFNRVGWPTVSNVGRALPWNRVHSLGAHSTAHGSCQKGCRCWPATVTARWKPTRRRRRRQRTAAGRAVAAPTQRGQRLSGAPRPPSGSGAASA